jgi:hypothetical protein
VVVNATNYLRGSKMKAVEYYANVLSDGHLSVPEHLKRYFKNDSAVRVMLLLPDDEADWDQMGAAQFLNGYSGKDAIYDNL